MQKINFFIFLFIFSLVICSCKNETQKTLIEEKTSLEDMPNKVQIAADLKSVLQKHLDAVTNKDITTLESTLSPNGVMQLILPGEEIRTTTKEFIDYHREWFKDTTWSFKTKILNIQNDSKLGMATVEIVYSEPKRDGKPYFNRMNISYGMERQDGKWYVIKDHASSVERSTD